MNFHWLFFPCGLRMLRQERKCTSCNWLRILPFDHSSKKYLLIYLCNRVWNHNDGLFNLKLINHPNLDFWHWDEAAQRGVKLLLRSLASINNCVFSFLSNFLTLTLSNARKFSRRKSLRWLVFSVKFSNTPHHSFFKNLLLLSFHVTTYPWERKLEGRD